MKPSILRISLFPFLTAILVSSLLFLLLSCAGQIPPSGGPVDTVPPEIVRTEPDSNAVRVETNSVLIEFSKYVDRRSAEESIFISPYVANNEFEWDGMELTIRFGEPLRRNTTYVVNIGTDVADVRAGNRMASGYTLAFSTGDSIDQGSISGRVYDEKPAGVMIFAYQTTHMNADTLNPARIRPDYIMQTGKDGAYLLSNIAMGSYRLFAVRDEYHNLLYDRQTDQYGVAQYDPQLTADKPAATGVNFRLSKEDTTMPFVAGARAVNQHLLQVRFSEPLDSVTLENARFTVTDTIASRPLPMLLAYRDKQTPSAVDLLLGSSLDSAGGYVVTAGGGITDRAGNPLDSTHATARLGGTALPDTLRPTVRLAAVNDSTRNVPVDRPFELLFSKPVRQVPLLQAVSLLDSTRRPVASVLRWTSPIDLILTPRKELSSVAWYQLNVGLDSVMDLFGRGYRDSTLRVRFQTMDLRATGSIEGTVLDTATGKNAGAIYLTAQSTGGGSRVEQTVRLTGTGSFMVDRLPEGYYVLSAFRDRDSSGAFTYGLPFPYRSSERFVVSDDTLRVRARWGVEGVEVRFK